MTRPHACWPLALVLLIACSTEGGDTTPASEDGEGPDVAEAAEIVESTEDVVDAPDPSGELPVDVTADVEPPAGACQPRPVELPAGSVFVDVSVEAGIQTGNYDPAPQTPIPINDHSRLAVIDLDGDGWDDIVMHSLFPNPQKGIPFEHLVFRNKGDGTFEDVSDASGLRNVQAGFFAFADVDNDGDQDVFCGLDVQLPGQTHHLMLNDGAGHFTAKSGSGLDSALIPTVAGNAVFLDFDGDAKLDLYVGNGQTSFAAPDLLFKGAGDGTFTDVTGLLQGNPSQPTNGTVTCDYDNDGDLDIFVSTYGVSVQGGLNVLWENQSGTFVNVAVERGFASLPGGNYWLGLEETPEPGKSAGTWVGSNGFGIDCGDVNGDGWMDVWLTAISHPVSSDYNRKWSDPSQLLIGQGDSGDYAFKNEFTARGLPFNEGDVDGAMIDFDNDGRLDLSVSRDKKYEKSYTEPDQKAWFGLMHQRPDGTFESIGVTSGINSPDAALTASLVACGSDAECPALESCLLDKMPHALSEHRRLHRTA